MRKRASEREKRRAREREKQIERYPHWRVGEGERRRERERERKREIEIESEKERTREKEKKKVNARVSLPIHIHHKHLFHLSGEKLLSGLETVVGALYLRCQTLVGELQQAHCSTTFKSIIKTLVHDRVELHLKMFRSIDTESRKPHRRTLTPNTHRMQVCILNLY